MSSQTPIFVSQIASEFLFWLRRVSREVRTTVTPIRRRGDSAVAEMGSPCSGGNFSLTRRCVEPWLFLQTVRV